jgi:uncharacterized protein (TIGR00299 family) protein
MLEAAPLPDAVRDGAMRAFSLLADAEARVHGVAPDAVHFHEVGAADSVADVVGVAAGLAMLGIEELVVSPVVVGHGEVASEHGMLPVPAPATALLLSGVPVAGGSVAGELTTPTGAALVRAFATGFGPLPAMTPSAVGHGAGTRELPIANVARLVIGEPEDGAPGNGAPEGLVTERVAVLETNLDHIAAERLAWTCDALLDAGARDVWQTPIVMKKGRSALTLSVLAELDDAARLSLLMIELTGTLGVRRTLTERDVVPRRVETVKTSLGPVRVKVALIGGKPRVRPEHDDIAAVAARENLSYEEVSRIVTAEAEEIVRW